MALMKKENANSGENFEDGASADTYIPELMLEKGQLPDGFIHCAKLLDQEINRIKSGDSTESQSSPSTGPAWVEVTKGRPLKVQVKVLVPVKDHPNFNFVGKLLGPKGNSLKRLQEESQTRMAILGKGSMRDKNKEEELRKQGEPKYSHLNDELHVEITAYAPPAEAYSRIAQALVDIKRFLIPDYYDDIRQDQLRELALINGDPARGPLVRGQMPGAPTGGRPAPGRGRGMPIAGRGGRGAITTTPRGGMGDGRMGRPMVRGGVASSQGTPPVSGTRVFRKNPYASDNMVAYPIGDPYESRYQEEGPADDYPSYEEDYGPSGEQDYIDYGHVSEMDRSYPDMEYGDNKAGGPQRMKAVPARMAPMRAAAKAVSHPYMPPQRSRY